MSAVLKILVYREPQFSTKYRIVGEKDHSEINKWRMKCRLKKSGIILAQSFQKPGFYQSGYYSFRQLLPSSAVELCVGAEECPVKG